MRLTHKGWEVGLQSDEHLQRLEEKLARIEAVKDLLSAHTHRQKNALAALKMPEVTIEELKGEIAGLDRFDESTLLHIDPLFDYDSIEALSSEGREKLKAVRPFSVGQASRINGVRNSDVAILIVHLKRGGAHV